MRKISMSNTKAVFKQTIMAMAKDQVFKFSKAAKQRQHHTTCFPPWNFITDSNEITHHTNWWLACYLMDFFAFFFIISDIEVLCLRIYIG